MDTVPVSDHPVNIDASRAESIGKSNAALVRFRATLATSPAVTPSMALVPIVKTEPLRATCDKCGIEASCTCNVAYSPRQRAEVAIAEHPELSNRAIAEISGVNRETIRKVRAATGNKLSVVKRVSKNGKRYPASQPAKAQKVETDATRTMRQLLLSIVSVSKVDAVHVANIVKAEDISRLFRMIGDLASWLNVLKEELYKAQEVQP